MNLLNNIYVTYLIKSNHYLRETLIHTYPITVSSKLSLSAYIYKKFLKFIKTLSKFFLCSTKSNLNIDLEVLTCVKFKHFFFSKRISLIV